MSWRRNRIYISFVFITIGFYTLICPKTVLKVIDVYAFGRDELDRIEADKDL